jgi:hypothetical protein
MDDMQAFERQVAGEVIRAAAPPRPVDVAAIFAAIPAATPSLRRRFQSAFNAARFVVAGAIVALFGGVLVAALLTQPSDLAVPMASSSPAAMTAEPTAAPAPELLPGVELTTMEVSPGVFRVLEDGIRYLDQGVYDVAIDADGGVWVLTGGPSNQPYSSNGGAGGFVMTDGPEVPVFDVESGTWATTDGRHDWTVARLGDPDVSLHLAYPSSVRLGLSAGGAPLISGRSHDLVFKGGAWVEPGPEDLPCPDAGVLLPDGVCWRSDPLSRLEDGRWRSVPLAELGLSQLQAVDGLAVGPDGTGWASIRREDEDPTTFDGLLRYDGASWTFVPPPPVDAAGAATGASAAIGVGPDDAVWLVQFDRASPGGYVLRRWDGSTWSSYGPSDSPSWTKVGASGPPRQPAPPHFDADGTIWFLGGELFFDGARLHPVERCWAGTDPQLCAGEISHKDASVDPVGNAWLATGEDSSDGRLYVITPEGAVSGGQGT